METGEGAAMLAQEEMLQRLEKLNKSVVEFVRRFKRREALRKKKDARRVERLTLAITRLDRLALALRKKKKDAKRLAEERAKMESRATKQLAEEGERAKMELEATDELLDDAEWQKYVERQEITMREEEAEREERAKMHWRAMYEIVMRHFREAKERQARRMGKPVADAGGGSKEEGKPAVSSSEAGSKKGKRKITKMIKLDQERVESVVLNRQPPFPRMPDWMFALAPEEVREEELRTRAFVDEIEAIEEDFRQQYIRKGYVEAEFTVEVTDDDEPDSYRLLPTRTAY
ncbi:unnamed protein product [Urochloa humidicola]